MGVRAGLTAIAPPPGLTVHRLGRTWTVPAGECALVLCGDVVELQGRRHEIPQVQGMPAAAERELAAFLGVGVTWFRFQGEALPTVPIIRMAGAPRSADP